MCRRRRETDSPITGEDAGCECRGWKKKSGCRYGDSNDDGRGGGDGSARDYGGLGFGRKGCGCCSVDGGGGSGWYRDYESGCFGLDVDFNHSFGFGLG